MRVASVRAMRKEAIRVWLRARATPWFMLWARVVLRARRPRIVGITGSVGKTSTKELLAAALSTPEALAVTGALWKTPGNLNDNEGIAYTVLGFGGWPHSLREHAARVVTAPWLALRHAFGGRYPALLVLEYGAGHGGEIRRTATLAPPTIAVVTEIGPAHLEVFGSIAGIVAEKSHLVRNVDPRGLVVLSGDNPHTASMAALSPAPVVRVPGRGRALSEAMVHAVADFLGVPRDAVARALAAQPAVPRRLDARTAGPVTVIDDSFNANPLSMTLALDTLAAWPRARGRRVAILGDMAELGTAADDYHRDIGRYARERTEIVVGVGELARHYGARHWYPDAAACARAVPGLVRAGDCILVKGSQSVGTDAVVTALHAAFGAGHEPVRDLGLAR